MSLEAIKKLLIETVGDDEATKVVESLEAFKTGLVAENEKTTKLKVDEAVNEQKVKLETSYLTKLEEHKAEADKKIAEEVTKYESALAKRVKTLLEQAVATHGEKLVQVAKENEAAKGSKLLNEVAVLVSEAKAEVDVQAGAAEKIKKLEAELAQVKEAAESEKKKTMEAIARKNVAEQNLKEIKESLDTAVQVTVTETAIEPTKGKPAGEQIVAEEAAAADAKAKKIDEGAKDEPAYTPEMQRMRKIAGIAGSKK